MTVTDAAQNSDYEIERVRPRYMMSADDEDLRITHTVCGCTDPTCFVDNDGRAWCTFCDDVELCDSCGDWPVAVPTFRAQRGGRCRCKEAK